MHEHDQIKGLISAASRASDPSVTAIDSCPAIENASQKISGQWIVIATRIFAIRGSPCPCADAQLHPDCSKRQFSCTCLNAAAGTRLGSIAAARQESGSCTTPKSRSKASPRWRGVARIDGKTVFVAGACGERARIRYSKRHRNYDEAKVEELLTRSATGSSRAARIRRLRWMRVPAPARRASIEVKQRSAEKFRTHRQGRPDRWLPPLSDEPWGYRAKAACRSMGRQKGKAVVVSVRTIRALSPIFPSSHAVARRGQRSRCTLRADWQSCTPARDRPRSRCGR